MWGTLLCLFNKRTRPALTAMALAIWLFRFLIRPTASSPFHLLEPLVGAFGVSGRYRVSDIGRKPGPHSTDGMELIPISSPLWADRIHPCLLLHPRFEPWVFFGQPLAWPNRSATLRRALPWTPRAFKRSLLIPSATPPRLVGLKGVRNLEEDLSERLIAPLRETATTAPWPGSRYRLPKPSAFAGGSGPGHGLPKTDALPHRNGI